MNEFSKLFLVMVWFFITLSVQVKAEGEIPCPGRGGLEILGLQEDFFQTVSDQSCNSNPSSIDDTASDLVNAMVNHNHQLVTELTRFESNLIDSIQDSRFSELRNIVIAQSPNRDSQLRQIFTNVAAPLVGIAPQFQAVSTIFSTFVSAASVLSDVAERNPDHEVANPQQRFRRSISNVNQMIDVLIDRRESQREMWGQAAMLRAVKCGLTPSGRYEQYASTVCQGIEHLRGMLTCSVVAAISDSSERREAEDHLIGTLARNIIPFLPAESNSNRPGGVQVNFRLDVDRNGDPIWRTGRYSWDVHGSDFLACEMFRDSRFPRRGRYANDSLKLPILLRGDYDRGRGSFEYRFESSGDPVQNSGVYTRVSNRQHHRYQAHIAGEFNSPRAFQSYRQIEMSQLQMPECN